MWRMGNHRFPHHATLSVLDMKINVNVIERCDCGHCELEANVWVLLLVAMMLQMLSDLLFMNSTFL